MMLLNVITEFCGPDEALRKKYLEDIDWAVSAILKHVGPPFVKDHPNNYDSGTSGIRDSEKQPGSNSQIVIVGAGLVLKCPGTGPLSRPLR